MAMLPEYYPVGTGGDPLEEYLRTLAQKGYPTDVYPRAISPFTRPQAIPSFGAIPGTQYNDYLGADPTRSLRLSSFRKNVPKSLRVDNPGATLPAEPSPSLEEDPITVLRRNTDRARNYPRESSEMFSPSFNPKGDIINFRRMNTDRARNYQRDSDYLLGKQTPPSMGPPPSTGNVSLPARPQTSATQSQSAPAQGGGLLDIDTDFFDDPTRMGLLQAGLGLMSSPRYSTNPNDVTLSSALARGLGGFVQGYGGTKKRLSDEERQRIEDERDARKEEYDIMYLRALTTDAISRANSMNATMTEKAEARRLAGQLKESQVSQILGKQPDLNQTQRVERRKQLMGMSPEMLQSEYHQFFPTAEMQETQNLREKLASYTGQPAETYGAYESKDLISAISKFEEPQKPEAKPTEGQKLRDDLERVFIYDPTTGERKIDHVYRNSPEYRKGIDQHLDSLQSSVSVGGVGTFEKPRYPLPDGIDWGVDLATPGRKVTDLGSFVQVEGLGDNQEKINSSFATLNKLQKLQNKLVEYGKPELAERLTKKDPKVRELVSDYYDLLLTLKEEYNLGVLTGNDEQIIKSVIADPTSVDLSNFFSGLDTFVASLNSVKKSVIDNLRPVASQYNIDIMDQYNAIPGYRPLTFDPISVVPPDNDSAGYNSEAKSILQEIQTDVGPQEDPNMWNPLNWFNNN